MVNQESDEEMALRLFQEGKSKADIGKVMGRDKKQVAKLLTRAMRAKGEQHGTH